MNSTQNKKKNPQKESDNSFATRLSNDDQQLVDKFISSGVNSPERKPFRFWQLVMWLSLSIIALGVAARVIGGMYLPF
jgi:uncharacterized membrane protein YcjF (UPF0283 family)